MNILYVIDSLVYGGAETQIMALAKNLSGRGHKVTLFSLAGIVPRAAELAGSGVHLVTGDLRWPLEPKTIKRLRGCVRDRAIDVIHGVLFDGDFYSRLAALGSKAFLVNSERNWNYRFDIAQTLGHHLTRGRVDCLVANSHSGLEFAAKRYRLDRTAMHVVWNGIDILTVDERIASSDNPAKHFFRGNAKVATFVGSFKKGKDVLFALDVANELLARDATWRVLFVGGELERFPGSYARQVEERYNSLSYKDRIRFTGNRDDALEIIAGSDILFSTSVYEGFPNVVLEAMTVGTPVISNDYSDISLILDQSQIVLSRNAVEYVDKLLAVKANSKATVKRQRHFVEKHCAIDTMASAYEAIYEEGVRHSRS